MFTWSWFGQSVPGCDDVAAIRDLYGLHDEEHGSIAGQVLGAGDRPILGAQVTLVSTRRGTVVQSVLTDRDGTWRVDGLDDDEVVVLVEPFVAGPQNLSAYWSELDHAICLLGAFPRTFIASDDPSEPDLFPVRRGVDLWLPTLRIDCDGSGELPAADDPDAPHLLIDGPGASFARVVLAPAGPEDRWFLLRDVHKDFTLDVLGWTLNSPVRARPTLFDMHGVPVWTSEVTEPAWQDPISGYVAWDSRIDVDLPASGDYVLRLESDGLPETLYPGGERYRDDRPFVLLLGRSGRPDESVSAAERLDCASDLELPGYLGADGPVRRREVVGCSVAAPGPRPLTLLLVVLIVLASGRARGCARARVSAAEAQEQTRRAGQADAAGSGARCAGGRLG
jgi:hypothetical protein